jgi:KDO2-lipid IV(A) lauroyltransferase
MPKRFFKNIIEYCLFLVMFFIVRTLPRGASLCIGKHLGGISRFILPKRRNIAFENIKRAFPEMPESEVKKTVRETFRHLGKSGMEMLQLDLFKGERDLQSFFQFTGIENLREAYTLNKGVFLITGHIGFWEIGTFFLPQLGFPVDFVAKKMKNPYINNYFLKLRETAGGHCIDSRHGARKILQSLSKNRGVCILLDQYTSRRKAVQINFFNRPAYTTPIITQIAMKQGVPIVPVFCYRTKTNRYEVIIEPMIVLKNDLTENAVVENTALITSRIEAAIRKNITQWLWLHRRWRD